MDISSLFSTWLSRPLIALALVSFGLLAAWSLVVPINEAPDEDAHWDYANYLHENIALPVGMHCSEYVQPPLYYIFIAPFAQSVQFPASLWWTDDQGIAHEPPTAKYFQNFNTDWTKYWPVRLVRLITALISALTVVFVYYSGVEITGKAITGVLAGALVAFLPQFTFRGMNVSNDALVTLGSAIATFCLIRMWKHGFSRRLAIVTAIVIGFAFLSKSSAVLFLGPFVLIVLTQAGTLKERFFRLVPLSLALAIPGPWLIRNQILYGDPLAAKADAAACMAVGLSYRPKSITDLWWYTTFPGMIGQSFVGMFGWMKLPLPDWIYALFALLAALAVTGYFWGWVHRRIDRRLTLVLMSIFALTAAEVISYNATFTQSQGRYLFPSLPTLAVLATLGLESIPLWSEGANKILVTGLALLNLYILFGVVLPVYWPAPEHYWITPIVEVAPKTPVGELVANTEFRQSFESRCNRLSRVQLFFGTFDRTNTHPVWFRLIDAETENTLFEQEIAASSIQDRAWHAIDFPPVPNSAGKEFIASVISPESSPGNAITVYRSQLDRYPAGSAFVNGAEIPSDLAFRYFCSY